MRNLGNFVAGTGPFKTGQQFYWIDKNRAKSVEYDGTFSTEVWVDNMTDWLS